MKLILKISLHFLIIILFINIVIAIVGNKCDLEEDAKFTSNEVEEYAKSNGLLYTLISALNGKGIEELFKNIGNELVKMEKENKSQRDSINDKNNNIDKTNDEKNDDNQKINKNRDSQDNIKRTKSQKLKKIKVDRKKCC